MTVADLTKNAVASMGGDLDDSALAEYHPYAYVSINTLLADLFSINNALRVQAEETALTEIPTVTASTDELTYNTNLLRNVMLFGLARDFAIKDNHQALGYFTRKYDENKSKYNIGVSSQVTDYYEDTEE